MAKPSDWPQKMMAVIRTGNMSAAIAQIKVAPTVKDLRQLQDQIARAGLAGRWHELDEAIKDNMALLSAPRLHRSP